MDSVVLKRAARGEWHLSSPYRGAALLRMPLCNKGSAFSEQERADLSLEGLLPWHITTMDDQRRRVHANLARKTDALEKYIGLASLQDRNECLFYRVLLDHIEELLPIVYTPTVGLACQEYSHIFRRARGLWITPGHRGRIYDVLGNAPFADVRLIVVTDNERILGLGDQGAGGMGIPIGKLALYTAAAGIPPWQTLPISLDVGTDNEELLADDLYLGWRDRRLRWPEYDSLVDEFVHAVKRRFPRALLQWEDFKKGNAFRLLDRYRGFLPSFNDDIEGTAAVAVAGLTAGARLTGIPLTDQKIVILGAGAAGVGIARLIRTTLRQAGLREESVMDAVACIDSRGLLVDDQPIADEHKRDFAWPKALAEARGLGLGSARDLRAVVTALRPNVLIGTSGEPGAFTEDVVREMARHVERPLVFPLSNPTSKSEAKPADVIAWTEGRALVATGSPFEPVNWKGRKLSIGQANNVFVFPGVGLGAMVSQAHEITEPMFVAAAGRLALEVSADDLASGSLYPPVRNLRRVARGIAAAVVREARDSGVGRSLSDEEIENALDEAIWEPAYAVIDATP